MRAMNPNVKRALPPLFCSAVAMREAKFDMVILDRRGSDDPRKPSRQPLAWGWLARAGSAAVAPHVEDVPA
jgi:hypothetical protein